MNDDGAENKRACPLLNMNAISDVITLVINSVPVARHVFGPKRTSEPSYTHLGN